MNTIVFENKTYTTRLISYKGEECLLAPLSLQARLFNIETFEPVSVEAEQIDEQICYYFSEEESKLSDKELYQLIYG